MNKFLNLSLWIFMILSVLGTTELRADEYWDQRVSLFDTLPIYRSDIVFLGNSITDGGEFSELFGGNKNIKNRGIRSDVINGVRKRLGQVTSGHPSKIFLLIGINDVSHNISAEKIADRYRELIKEIRTQSPETRLYVQSIMPINNSFGRYRNLVGKEPVIRNVNLLLEDICAEEGAIFVDLGPSLSDSNGNLKRELTNDGLHLTGKGYHAWSSAIADLVSEPTIDENNVLSVPVLSDENRDSDAEVSIDEESDLPVLQSSSIIKL